jgi:hypothetical protein
MVKNLFRPELRQVISRLASLVGSETVKGGFGGLIGIIASLILVTKVGLAQPVTPHGQVLPEHMAAQAQPSSGQSSGTAGMGMMGMMGQEMSGPGMKGRGMMGGPGGMMAGSMMPGCMMDMQMMMNDPKTRGQMLEIHGRMGQEIGQLMERRGKEIEQGK